MVLFLKNFHILIKPVLCYYVKSFLSLFIMKTLPTTFSEQQIKELSQHYFRIIYEKIVDNPGQYGYSESWSTYHIKGNLICKAKQSQNSQKETEEMFLRYLIDCDNYKNRQNITIKNSFKPYTLYLSRKDCQDTNQYKMLYFDESLQYEFFKTICEKIPSDYFHEILVLSGRHFSLSVRLRYFIDCNQLSDFLFLWKAKRPTFLGPNENQDLIECLKMLREISLKTPVKIALIHDFINVHKTEFKRIEMQKLFYDFICYDFGSNYLQEFNETLILYQEDSYPLYAPTFPLVHIRYNRTGLFRALSNTKIKEKHVVKSVLNRVVFCLNRKEYANQIHITNAYLNDEQSGGEYYTVFIHLNAQSSDLDYPDLVLFLLTTIFNHSDNPDYQTIDRIVKASIRHYLINKSVNDKIGVNDSEANLDDEEEEFSSGKI
jgi:hypothetical protein